MIKEYTQNVEFIHTERSERLSGRDLIPNIVVKNMLEKGEKAIRRKLREWPYGKSLDHSKWYEVYNGYEVFRISWFWVDE